MAASAGNPDVAAGVRRVTDTSHSIRDGSFVATDLYTNLFDATAHLGVLSFPFVGAKLSMSFVSTLLDTESGSVHKSLDFSTGTFDHRASFHGVL